MLLLLVFLLILVFSLLLFPSFVTIFIIFIILALLYLLSFSTLNIMAIMLFTFLMDTNLVITLTTVIIWFSTRMFLKIIIAVVMFQFRRIKLRIILLLEKVMYVLRRTTPNVLNLIILVAISQQVLVSQPITLLLLFYLILYLLLILCINLILYLSIGIFAKVE